jgi:hypothetical protein
MKTTDNVNYICDGGRVFRHKTEGIIMGNGLSLGENDSIENYEEIEEPKEQEEE